MRYDPVDVRISVLNKRQVWWRAGGTSGPSPWIRHCCKLLNPWEFQNILQTILNRKTKPRTGHNVIQLCMKISHSWNYGKPLSFSDPEALWRKVKSLKALFSRTLHHARGHRKCSSIRGQIIFTTRNKRSVNVSWPLRVKQAGKITS